jgi:hypothetical protein
MRRVERLRRHARALATEHAICVTWVRGLPRGAGLAHAAAASAVVPQVRSEADYAVALHEFGHVLVSPPRVGRGQADLVHEEFAAWRWARWNALTWTASMRRAELRALRTYLWRLDNRRLTRRRKR